MKNTENNLRKVLMHLALREHFLVSKTYLENAITTHPAPNSFACLSDVLDELQVANMTVRLKKEQLATMSFPAVAHLQEGEREYYALLTACKINQVEYYDSEKGNITENLEDFSEKWTGELLLVSPDEQSGEASYAENRKKEQWKRLEKGIILLGIVSVLGSGLLMNDSWASGLLFSLVSLGAFASALLLWAEYGKPPAAVAEFCTGKNASCEEVLHSPAAKLWGRFSWAEVGFVYFVGNLFALLLQRENEGMMALFSIFTMLALPYTVFSVYYQARVVKKWCRLCLVVQGVVWGSFFALFAPISLPLSPVEKGELVNRLQIIQTIDLQTIGFYLLCFFAPLAVWLLFKQTLLVAKGKEEASKQVGRLQRDTKVFTAYLQSGKYVEIGNPKVELILGNPDAPITVTVVCNPYCNPCGRAHRELHQWIGYFSESVCMVVRFYGDINPDSKKNKAIKHLISLYQSEHLHQALLDWFENPDYETFAQKYPMEFLPNIDEIVAMQTHWCQSAEVQFTPTIFLNGKQLQAPYNYTDLKYHFRALIENEALIAVA
jgi:protein-disulfide isomerase/uncharacterized membrane protein